MFGVLCDTKQAIMHTLLLLLNLFLQQPAPSAHTVFVLDSVIEQAEAHNTFGGVGGTASENHLAPIVIGVISKRCPETLHFTEDRSSAEYVLKPQQGSTMLLDAKGNVLYVSPAKLMGNMAKDVCKFVSTR